MVRTWSAECLLSRICGSHNGCGASEGAFSARSGEFLATHKPVSFGPSVCYAGACGLNARCDAVPNVFFGVVRVPRRRTREPCLRKSAHSFCGRALRIEWPSTSAGLASADSDRAGGHCVRDSGGGLRYAALRSARRRCLIRRVSDNIGSGTMDGGGVRSTGMNCLRMPTARRVARPVSWVSDGVMIAIAWAMSSGRGNVRRNVSSWSI